MLNLAFLVMMAASEYQAPDRSFTIPVPAGWRVRTAQAMTIVEPADGGVERIVVGSGVAAARTIQELSQQAAGLAGQFLPGARITAGPVFKESSAEQEYSTGNLAAWNGMVLRGEFYFAVMAMGPPATLANLQARGREILAGAKWQGPARNLAAEQALIGRWELSSYKSTRTGVRDRSSYSSNWTVVLAPGNRFRSTRQNYFDTTSEVYGGGNVGASDVQTGTFRMFGPTLVADVDGTGRQLFSLEMVGTSGVKLNGQLFLRQ